MTTDSALLKADEPALPVPDLEGTSAGWPDRAIPILLEVAESMMTAKGERAALSRLAALALEATGADRCAILVRDPQGQSRLLPAAGASRVDDDLEEQWRRFREMEPIEVDGNPNRLALWRAHRTVTLDNVPSSDLLPDDWKKVWGSKSLAFTSLRAGGEIYGLLAVDYVTKSHRFVPGETRLLDAIACAAGVALRNARLVEKLRRSVEVERRLAECAAAVQSGRSLGEVLDLVVDRFTSLLPEAACSINLLSEDQESFRAVAYRGNPPPDEVIPLSELPPSDIAHVRAIWEREPARPVTISDARALEGWQKLVPPTIGPAMLIPLWDGERVLGFVAAGRERHPFTKEELKVAVAFAGQAAVAVSKARLHEALQARLLVIETLTKLNDIVMRTSDLKHVIASLNSGVCKEIGVECTKIAFADPSVAAILGTRRPNATESRLLQEWRSASPAQPMVIGADVVVPIHLRGRAAGILWIRPAKDIDATKWEFLKAIAGCLGEVASKAKLRRTVEKRSRELALASERERIAQDLHDTVGQTFYGIGLKLQDLILDIDDPALIGRLAEVRSLAAQAVTDVRSAVYALSFLHVRSRGLVPSLRALTRQFSQATGVHADLRIEGKVPTLGADAESALFRITHEALVNVDRHSRATGVVVRLTSRPTAVEVAIRDDGVGLDQRQVADWRSAAHFGMRTMAKAAAEANGHFSVAAAQPRGLVIKASVPARASRRTARR